MLTFCHSSDPLVIHVAEVGDRFGRTLGGDHELVTGRRFPDVRKGQETRRERELPHLRPVGMEVVGIGELEFAQLMKCLFHGIEGISLAGEDSVLDDPMELFGELCLRIGVQVISRVGNVQFADRHLVLSERARLIDTQHRGGTEGFDGGYSSGQHLSLGKTPCAEGQEDREDNREFLG